MLCAFSSRWLFQRKPVAAYAHFGFGFWTFLWRSCVCVVFGLSCGVPWCQIGILSMQLQRCIVILTFYLSDKKVLCSWAPHVCILQSCPGFAIDRDFQQHDLVFLPTCELSHSFQDFDSTLGYPGEGPPQANSLWTLTTANIGSLKQNKHWKSWTTDVACLQETRIGKNNLRDSTFSVKATGKKLFPGALLPGLITTHGQQRITHGGTAIIGPEQLVTPFSSKEDVTGKYDDVVATKRANACWVQVLPNLRLLIFSVYARTSASQDVLVHQFNDSLFGDILEICAQFGDVPIIIAGDFQADPLSYESLSNALLFCRWVDPLQTVDAQGLTDRPLTYSNDGNFTGVGDHCSSIDAMLLNPVAAAALKNMWIDELFGIQHRPIHASFEWVKACQQGHVLQKFAAFDLSHVPDRSNKDAFREFENDVKTAWHAASNTEHLSADDQWANANQFCINTLVSAGAKWAEGPRLRGQAPVFHTKQHCPGQSLSGCATTLKLSWLYRALGSVHELQVRFSRPTQRGIDAWVTFRTINKLRNRLEKLASPFLWKPFELPALVMLDHCSHWLLEHIHDTEHNLKLARLRSWKRKIAQSLTGHKSYIYKHLRNKANDEPANLVTNADGHIILQPDQAISTINQRWDEVFAVNAGFPHPIKMLEIIWPYIQTKTHAVDVPQLTAYDLQQVVLARKPLAAPGLDGWRTIELQCLPTTCFEPFAQLFHQLEHNDIALPKSLVCARQMILNKNGSSCPMQKRLITVLPIVLLAYTGCRFRHLKTWQMESMPPSLQGGISKRRMEAVHTHMKLSIDQAITSKQPLIGVKLDKAKCFDRVIPSYAAALMLSYGVPKSIVTFFTKIYNGLHRHLSYKSWISPTATTPANGVAQGCSMSLIAINVYMKTWCHLLEFLPEVTTKAFIDDSYLWAHLSNAHVLERAVAVTKMWDEISGQLLNDEKSTIWGTTRNARKVVKKMFPTMKLALAFDVLGTWIRTATVPCATIDDAKLSKILTDTKNISVLPIPTGAKSELVGAKVITQCTYGAAINNIPKLVASKIQSAIACTFWFRRPHWRNKMLLFSLLHKPHRVEPTYAGAYCAIMDFLRFLRAFPDCWDLCNHLLSTIAANKFNYMRTVVEAFNLLGIRLDCGLLISFQKSTRIPLCDCDPKDLKKTLQHLVRNACYHAAAHKTRKDMSKPSGVLDFDLTSTFWKFSKLSFESEIPAKAFFEAQLVGCQLTKDRLYAADCVDDPCCRFCDYEKESLQHLVEDCPYVREHVGTLAAHELGPNFTQLGIVEHPLAIIKHRLQWSDTNSIHVVPFSASNQRLQFWTDGSIFWSDTHWLTSGSFAVVDESLQVLRSGPVFHWSLSSYTTELWAILEACACANTNVIIGSDCQTVVGQCWIIMDTKQIPSSWSHQSWWAFFLHLWINKYKEDINALEVFWTPAHLYEGIPIELISPQMAQAKGTTTLDIKCNRKADLTAKDVALQHCVVHPEMKQTIVKAILLRQEFLTKISYLLGLDTPLPLAPEKFETRDEVDLTNENDIISYFHGWKWTETISSFKLRIRLQPSQLPPPKWGLPEDDWITFKEFLCHLQWQKGSALSISYAELACLFALRGYKLTAYDEGTTLFSDLIPTIKRAFFWCRNLDAFERFPGVSDPHKARKIGKCMPHGTIEGVMAFISFEEKLTLGRLFLNGVSTPMKTWSFPVAEIFA